MASFEFVKKLIPLPYMTDFVLNGCSAGGLAVYSWVDYFRDVIFAVNPKVKYFGLSDSGIFLNIKNVNTRDNDFMIKMQQLYDLVDKEMLYPN